MKKKKYRAPTLRMKRYPRVVDPLTENVKLRKGDMCISEYNKVYIFNETWVDYIPKKEKE